jgi:TRAP-type transport system periplasmic protein
MVDLAGVRSTGTVLEREMKRVLILFILLALPLAWMQTQAATPVELDCNAVYPASNFHTMGAQAFAGRVAQYTHDSVRITVHPDSSLGFKSPELLKAVKDGVLPMSDMLMGAVAGSEEIFGLTTIPMLVHSLDQAFALYQTARPYYEKACEKWNQKLLYAAPWPQSGLHTKKPILGIEDLAGLKIRSYDQNSAEFLQRAGASPLPLPWGEVHTALSTGLIDAVLTSATSGLEGRFWEVLSDFTMIDYSCPLNILTINLDSWNSLSSEQQEAMLRAAAETEEAQWRASRHNVLDSLLLLEENGMAIHKMTPRLAAELEEIAAAMRRDMTASAGEDLKAVLHSFGR